MKIGIDGVLVIGLIIMSLALIALLWQVVEIRHTANKIEKHAIPSVLERPQPNRWGFVVPPPPSIE